MILWLKNIVYWLVLVVFTVLLFPFMLAGAFLPRGIHWLSTLWARVNLRLLSAIIGLRFELTGRENIPATPCVVCSKHQSGWETLAVQEIFPPIVFVAKRSLFMIPIFGWCLKWAGTIGIDRTSPSAALQQILAQGKKRRDEGFWICIFPEGTRMAPGQIGRYKSGAARIAQALAMPIVPVALNSGEFWPKNSFLKYPGVISVAIGPPIAPEGSPDALMQRVQQWIEDEQSRIGGVGPCAPASHARQ